MTNKKKYVESLGRGNYKFNVRDFCKVQKNIYDKFDMKVPYMQNINNYFLHVMEEVYEVQTSSGKKEEMEELIDVLMYLGSTINCFHTIDIDKLPESININTIVSDKESVIETTNRIVFSLLSLRREFSERKWHKYYDPNEINYEERDKKVRFTLLELISEIIEILILNNDYKTINNAIERKQSFIYKLPRLNSN